MRRFVAFLLLTPLLASCSDSVTPVAPKDAAPRHDESAVVESQDPNWVLDESPFEDSWTQDDWTNAGTAAVEAQPLDASGSDASTMSAPGTGAVMEFGHPGAGAPFPITHDESYHAADKVYPGTVVIDAHQAVTFKVAPGHRVAIYKPGKRPQDVVIVPGSFFIFDPTNRQALQAAPVPEIKFIFNKPGTFLVICAVTRHFVEANMYGWVHVRDIGA